MGISDCYNGYNEMVPLGVVAYLTPMRVFLHMQNGVGMVGGLTLTYWTCSRRERVRNTRLNLAEYNHRFHPFPFTTPVHSFTHSRLSIAHVSSKAAFPPTFTNIPPQARSTRAPAARFVLPSPRHNYSCGHTSAQPTSSFSFQFY